ncbi:TIGR00730 family Rossman fold protein [Telmatocola sphagniphila]|uniref:AMP nucleosidase n=1 Tax=Telmatocola sphagniphila TaxID=1123043 RepID=A0A8E6B8I0_9BACT|nr:TIGR00730 family Rossman fold protein [Telmatocola sphagniphila]QVL33317.1 TIGR00730 family Rossman fold protein [Telmatocola sphagniphila]
MDSEKSENPEIPLEIPPYGGNPKRRRDTSNYSVEDFAREIKETADKLVSDGANRGDIKLISSALKELRYCFKVFNNYKGRPKVTIFGSARTKPQEKLYKVAVDFGREIVKAGYMVITGAASGIMEAGHEGAEREMSIGVNIQLPFEQFANPIILGDQKLMTMKYFFTRKLMFVKETDAVVLFPGGFGTHDEGFEVLTLIQTGKSHMFPVVCLDEPGGTYWKLWDNFIREELLAKKMISPADLSLYSVTDDVNEAVREIQTFYRVYHSMRYVRGELVLRLKQSISPSTLEDIRAEYADICPSGNFELTKALPAEANEPALADLPRLKFKFDRRAHGRLRQLINHINRA